MEPVMLLVSLGCILGDILCLPIEEDIGSQVGLQGPKGCTCVPYYLCNDNVTNNDDGEGLIDIIVKSDDCNHYLEKCCRVENIRPSDQPTLPTVRPVNKNSSCGSRNVKGIDPRLNLKYIDNEARYGEFPWVVAVLRPDSTLSPQRMPVEVFQCGGSLIHPQVVLTAAHCVSRMEKLVVRAGEWDTQTNNELYQTQDRRVLEVILHEEYNKNLANDVALLILESTVDMSDENVGLICLPEANEVMDGRKCLTSGWGKDLYGKEGRYSVILIRVDLLIVPRDPCIAALRKTRLGSRFELHESFICAGGQPGKNNCQGVPGGLLFCPSRNNEHEYVQAGVVSWAISCATEIPAVYVNVPLFVDWIKDKIHSRNITF